MKYLFISQYFYPEEFRGNDIAFDWAKRGDHVTVITAIPNYPTGKFFQGYGLLKKRKEVIHGVNVIRIPVIPRGQGNNIMLMLNYFSFAFFGSLYVFFLSFTTKFDSIFVQQLSPITLAIPAVVAKKIQKVPLYLWVLDLWPESLTSAGNIHNKLILGTFEGIVKFIYKNSDKILISSKEFRASICSKGDFNSKIIYFPNWAEDIFNVSAEDYKLPPLPDGFIVMFAGNIGEAQDLENVMKAAYFLKDQKQIKFVILGDGRKKAWTDEFCLKYELTDTVYCLGRYPLISMPYFFAKADLMLVSLKDEPIFNLTLPAKIQAYMAACKPIVGMMNGEGARIIDNAQCGVCAKASDYEALANNIKMLSMIEKRDIDQLGLNGQNFAKMQFNKSILLDNLYFEIMKI
jgi:glycosyltransferase involved in cell wall biosynthesis